MSRIELIKNFQVTLLTVIILIGTSGIAADEQKKIMLSAQSKENILSVLKVNEDLHKAYFNYDAKEVESTAEKLKVQIKKVIDPQIARLLKFSVSKLNEIKATNTREKNNQSYHLISMALIHILKTYNLGSHYTAYTCPMVKKRWIQSLKLGSKVHNPYASNMPHCGSEI